jgi:uncharacterized protein YecE (DUF72 family)
MGDIRIGISGWRYVPWRGVFYPKGLAQRLELDYASRMFSSIELNGSFYSLQRPSSYANWYAATPGGFTFSVKAPRYITHILRLREVEKPLANFLASGVLQLKEKLGPILWQFPPRMQFDTQRFENFLKALPHDTRHAGELAAGYEQRLDGRVSLDVDACRPIRHAVEVRDDSFLVPHFVDLLRRHGVGLVVADSAGKWPDKEDVTADFVYIRLHGGTELYTSGYGDDELERWRTRITAWANGGQADDARLIVDTPPVSTSRDVYCYFDNDAKVHAPFNARDLMRKLGLPMEPV